MQTVRLMTAVFAKASPRQGRLLGVLIGDRNTILKFNIHFIMFFQSILFNGYQYNSLITSTGMANLNIHFLSYVKIMLVIVIE